MAEPIHLSLEAIDTLMFRDGRPFNQADAGASRAVSVFPPYPPTMVGAVRAALWRAAGTWDETVLGNGTDWRAEKTLHDVLAFGPPLIVRRQAGTVAEESAFEPLFPVPLHVIEGKGAKDTKVLTRLSPGAERHCDLGKVRLPAPPEEPMLAGIDVIEDRFVTSAGLAKIIAGEVPDKGDLVKISELWQREERVGLGIERQSRTTTDGNLYMASHIRMAEGVSLAVTVEKQSGGLFGKRLMPFGGEHRMVEIGLGKPVRLPPPPETINGGRYCAIQISPMVLDEMPKPGGALPGLPGLLISACLGKPVSIGGWDSIAKRPIPLREAVPAGSVWFFEGGDVSALDWHGRSIGIGADWGFGRILIGRW